MQFIAILLQVPNFEKGILGTLVYATVGIIMSVIGFKIVDWITPGDLARQIGVEKNMAVALVASALILGICIIIAASIAS